MNIKEAMVWIDVLDDRIKDLRQCRTLEKNKYGQQMAKLESLKARLNVDVIELETGIEMNEIEAATNSVESFIASSVTKGAFVKIESDGPKTAP